MELSIEEMFKNVMDEQDINGYVFDDNGFLTDNAMAVYSDVADRYFDGNIDALDALCDEEDCFGTSESMEDDDLDFNFESDFDDGEVVRGGHFDADGYEYEWIEYLSDVEHLDFNAWQVWSAENQETGEIQYFVVDVDDGFIDWGPCDTEEEAIEFFNGKVADYEAEEYMNEYEAEFGADGYRAFPGNRESLNEKDTQDKKSIITKLKKIFANIRRDFKIGQEELNKYLNENPEARQIYISNFINNISNSIGESADDAEVLIESSAVEESCSISNKNNLIEEWNPLLEKIAKELNKYLRQNNFYEEVYDNGMNQLQCDISWGDWKHEHLRFKYLVDEFCKDKDIEADIHTEITEDDGSDTYSASHYINIKQKKLQTQSNAEYDGVNFDSSLAKKHNLKPNEIFEDDVITEKYDDIDIDDISDDEIEEIITEKEFVYDVVKSDSENVINEIKDAIVDSVITQKNYGVFVDKSNGDINRMSVNIDDKVENDMGRKIFRLCTIKPTDFDTDDIDSIDIDMEANNIFEEILNDLQ